MDKTIDEQILELKNEIDFLAGSSIDADDDEARAVAWKIQGLEIEIEELEEKLDVK